ncbi:uncharacterized protein PV09_04305 [Verruconis gallopava]|uniref:Uncharacterized protein n=1 Tax=Verruconis gallopava TaxID=253628 RepID=A0A0D1XPT3_9PEZI|nr:uncharacterized protein PV09_04305 [Verruconis gallopava]KIW04551.1 hypothetical protein PV09_04305 [Verruconis gallopava]
MAPVPELTNLTVTLKDAVAVLTYNRPKAGNALSLGLMQDLLVGLRWADNDDRVKVIVQTGEGRLFTAGLDLQDKAIVTKDTVLSNEFSKVICEVHKTMINSDKVLVTAVNGAAPGWGTSSLALADLVYASPDAYFFTPFVQLGICAEACSSVTFAKIMGHQKAASLLLAGDRFSAAELESAGLVTKVLPKENFLEAVLAQCYRIAKLPSESLKLNKRMMMRSCRQELLDVNDFELEELGKKARSQEARAAVEGFLADQASRKKGKPPAKL